jgi:hypothetical protein
MPAIRRRLVRLAPRRARRRFNGTARGGSSRSDHAGAVAGAGRSEPLPRDERGTIEADDADLHEALRVLGLALA